MKSKEDKLNRQEEADFLINYLEKRFKVKPNESFVLNINAKWGYGKTFFLQELLKNSLEERKYEVIYFDAWKNDFTKDALLAFFAEINSSLEKYLKAYNQTSSKPLLKNIFKSSLPLFISVLTKHLTGLTLDEFDKLLEEENGNINEETKDDTKTTLSSIMSKATEIALKEHNTIKNSIKEFNENMQTILDLIKEEKSLPLFILIDELDRCRPNYAIELLENIKHIFDIPNIYFIIATNSKQLSHSINAIYGINFSSQTYLKRFFDLEYNLKEPNRYEFINFLFEKNNFDDSRFFNFIDDSSYENKNKNVIMILELSNIFELSLRDITQVINHLFTVYLSWENQIDLFYTIFLICCKQKNKDFDISNFSSNISNEFNKNFIYITTYQIDEFYRNKRNEKKEISSLAKILDYYKKIIYAKNEDYHEINRNTREFDIIKDFYRNIKEREKLKNYPKLIASAAQLSGN